MRKSKLYSDSINIIMEKYMDGKWHLYEDVFKDACKNNNSLHKIGWCNYTWHDIISALSYLEDKGYDIRHDGDWVPCIGGMKISYDKFKVII